jgi:nicotinate (nicotinamide) nucleotide adenylyltransferase
MTIGLFGGSFDPIHHGHLLVAQAVVEVLGLEELRFVPAREQPFKIGRHAAPAETRARMVGMAIAGESRFALERIELERAGNGNRAGSSRCWLGLMPRAICGNGTRWTPSPDLRVS